MASSILDSSVPLLTLSTNYLEWKMKMKMIASLKRQDLYEVSIGLGEESYESKNDLLNACDGDFGTIGLTLSPSLRYLSRSIEDPKELWTRLDKTFGKIDEDHNNTFESTFSTIIVPDPKFSSSTLSVEFFQDEKEAKSSSSDFPLNYAQICQ